MKIMVGIKFLFVGIATTIIICLGILLVMSPGRIKQFTDENGKKMKNSIGEKCFVEVNGFEMGMIIKSKDVSNPVLLFVHGGPGMPEYFLTEDYPTGLEDYYTVVYWDQRGAGLSYADNIDKGKLTVEQYIEDTIGVTNYLRERFKEDKIYLMAHSWGTYFSIQAVEKEPQLYHAYIGIAQVTNQKESEKKAYDYMLDYYSKGGDEKTLKKLKNNKYPSDGYFKIRDDVMHRSGIGTTHLMKSVMTGVFFASLKNREYTLAEKINLWRGKLLLNQNIQLQMKVDLRKEVTSLEIPVYFFSGIYDYTVNYEMSEEYLKQIEAPVKEFYLFKKSAHSPIFEEPNAVLEIMKTGFASP